MVEIHAQDHLTSKEKDIDCAVFTLSTGKSRSKGGQVCSNMSVSGLFFSQEFGR